MVVPSSSSDEEDYQLNPAQDDDYDDWVDDLMDRVQCLYCDLVVDQPTILFEHLISDHQLNILHVKKELKLDEYGWIRLVNYIRSKTLQGIHVSQPDILNHQDWIKNDQYLKPVLENDVLLQIMDDEEESIHEFQNLSLESKLKNTEMELYQLKESFAMYKKMVQESLMPNNVTPTMEKEETDYYFTGYGYNDIHAQMLKDTVRTEGYRDFIYQNKNVFEGKIVMDIGCGTGILSMFAAKAGAAQVIAVDNSSIIEKAKLNAIENGLQDKIIFCRGKMEEVVLPVDKVDIIISEWMGYFLLFEGMLDSVLWAKDRYLATNGFLAPSRTDILIAAFEDEEFINDHFNYWNEVYGFKMTAMKDKMTEEGFIDVLPQESILSTSATLKRIDIASATVFSLDFVTEFELECLKDGVIHGLCGWFDTFFDASEADSVFFSTGPSTTPTHWKQTLFVLDHFISVQQGQKLMGKFKCHKHDENPRELKIELNLTTANGEEYQQSFLVR